MRKAAIAAVFGLVLVLAACAPPKGADGQPAVIITSPTPGATITSPTLHVTGTADVFEATFRIQLVDASTGTSVYSEQMVMATCGTGCRGDFDIIMGVPPISGQLKLKAFLYSAKDGSRVDLAEVPVVAVLP